MALELSSLLAAGNEQLLKLVDRRHPEYKDNVEHWRFLESSYRGGRDWIEKNLFTYTKEGNKEFEERKKRAFRLRRSGRGESVRRSHQLPVTAREEPDEAAGGRHDLGATPGR